MGRKRGKHHSGSGILDPDSLPIGWNQIQIRIQIQKQHRSKVHYLDLASTTGSHSGTRSKTMCYGLKIKSFSYIIAPRLHLLQPVLEHRYHRSLGWLWHPLPAKLAPWEVFFSFFKNIFCNRLKSRSSGQNIQRYWTSSKSKKTYTHEFLPDPKTGSKLIFWVLETSNTWIIGYLFTSLPPKPSKFVFWLYYVINVYQPYKFLKVLIWLNCLSFNFSRVVHALCIYISMVVMLMSKNA